jgi:hypothetical protein
MGMVEQLNILNTTLWSLGANKISKYFRWITACSQNHGRLDNPSDLLQEERLDEAIYWSSQQLSVGTWESETGRFEGCVRWPKSYSYFTYGYLWTYGNGIYSGGRGNFF